MLDEPDVRPDYTGHSMPVAVQAAKLRQLRAAYRAARYVVMAPGGTITLRCGALPAREQDALRALGVRQRWALITPCNPRSRRLRPHANRARLRRFHAELRARCIRWYPSVNRDPAGRWPDEPGALLVDVAPALARALARRYRQNAFLTARRGRPAYLVWTGPATAIGT